MNGKRARALRKIALETAIEALPRDPKTDTIRYANYSQQQHMARRPGPLGAPYVKAVTAHLGPCIRKVEKEAKREYKNLTR